MRRLQWYKRGAAYEKRLPTVYPRFFSSRENEELIGLSVSGMLALASHKLEGLTYLDLRTQISHQHRILQMKHVENLRTHHPFAFLFLCRHSETEADHRLQIIHLEEGLVEFLDACHLIIGEPIRGLLIPKLIHHLCIELVIIDDRTVVYKFPIGNSKTEVTATSRRVAEWMLIITSVRDNNLSLKAL